MTDAERPKSSWQSWVSSTEARRSGEASPDPGGPAAADDADLDVVLAWNDPSGADPEADPSAPGTATPSWTTWRETDSGAAPDDDGFGDDDVLVSVDDGEAGHDDDGEFGELMPVVPLLPSIAGRVEALSGVLRSITHRVDNLTATTDVYRATVVDRIDQFTETVLEQGRRSDQSLDEYRRSTERTIGELRRGLGEQSDGSKKLLARVEEIATDVAALAHAAPGEAVAAREPSAAPAAGAAIDPAWVDHIDASLDEVAKAQQATAQALDEVQVLVAAIVDTMPASAEGSAADVAGALARVEAALEALAEAASAPAPPPTEAAPAAPTAAVIDDSMVATIADAIVDRLDLDALAMLVAEHLSATFEVVDEPGAPAPEAAGPDAPG